MFFDLIKFEFNYFKKQPSFYITILIFFLISFIAMVTDIHLGVFNENVYYNSPFAIGKFIVSMSFIAMFLLANFIGNTATRDYSSKMNMIIYAMPINKSSYLWARLIGSIIFCLLIFLSVPLGILLGSFAPWLDSSQLTLTSAYPYLVTYLIFIIPNFIFIGTLFYSFAVFSRSMMGMYLGVIGFFILKAISSHLLNDPSLSTLSALLDPFGNHAFSEVSKFFTAHDMNTKTIGFETLVLQNRLLWLSITSIIILLTHFFINFRKLKETKIKVGKISREEIKNKNILKIKPSISISSSFNIFITRVKFETIQIIKTPSFLILLLLSIAILLSSLFNTSNIENWPTTSIMSEYIMGSFSTLIIIVITYYVGEIIWKEKDVRISEIIEATPISNFSLYIPKVLAIFSIIILLLIMAVGITVSFQIFKGYTNFEFDVYFILLTSIFLIPLLMNVILSFFFQIISPNKYIGMFIFILYFISIPFLSKLGIEHNMYKFNELPEFIYSNMNGYGHFIEPLFAYNLYWLGLTIIIFVLSYTLYNREKEYNIKYRVSQIKNNIGTFGALTITIGLIFFINRGLDIHYNTTVLNKFITEEKSLDLSEDYEKKYKKFENKNITKITDINVNVDIYPKKRKVEVTGYYLIKNKTNEDIKKELISWSNKNDIEINIIGARIKDFDKMHNTGWLVFNPPIKPNESRKLNFIIKREAKGFVDRRADNAIVYNGTFINNLSLFPHFGYSNYKEITSRKERKKRNLPKPKRMAKLENKNMHKINMFSKEADFINYEAIVSTSSDQFAITPGYLQKSWEEDGRKYFHYKMDAPIDNFVAFQSGIYQVQREQHNGVSIEVYYHKDHNKNIKRMVDAVKLSLDIYSKEFSPYQYKQFRIIEFPNYRNFAQSFPNTIPYSEGMGFINDLRDQTKSDFVSFVTAHEAAHQWWGHQVIPANVQGAAVLSESLAEYSAYLVIKKLYGEYRLRDYLKNEMNRYLESRGTEILDEMPLLRSENQSYIHYFKGGLVMYALSDRLGEKVFNQALKNFLSEFKYKSDPYPTTLNLKEHIKAVAKKSDYNFIEDMFNKITIYDFKMKKAEATKLENGNYEVKLIIEANKYYADGKGKETVSNLDNFFDIGIFSKNPDDILEKENILKLNKYNIKSGKNEFIFEVKSLPKYAGIDPYFKMIDKNIEDNVLEIEVK